MCPNIMFICFRTPGPQSPRGGDLPVCCWRCSMFVSSLSPPLVSPRRRRDPPLPQSTIGWSLCLPGTLNLFTCTDYFICFGLLPWTLWDSLLDYPMDLPVRMYQFGFYLPLRTLSCLGPSFIYAAEVIPHCMLPVLPLWWHSHCYVGALWFQPGASVRTFTL
jgi:hypothetical protein